MGPADAYLEQSTRYIAYDARLGGRYRYYRDPEVLGSPLGTRYVGDMDRLFDTYAELRAARCRTSSAAQFPKDPGDSDFVYRQAIRAKAFDALRGILPAASLSNVGIYGTGQAYEALLLRMRAHPLPEARAYADLMLTELRKVIPSFLKRVDLADRGVAWSDLPRRAPARPWRRSPPRLLPAASDADRGARRSTLVDFDPDAEVKLVAAMLYPYTDLPEHQIERRVRAMSRRGARWRSCGPTSASGPTAATSRAGRSSGVATASTCSPTTAPSATSSATACSPSSGSALTPAPRLHPARGGRPRRRRRRVRRGDGALGRALRRARRAASRPRRPTPCAWPTRSAS